MLSKRMFLLYLTIYAVCSGYGKQIPHLPEIFLSSGYS